MGNEVQLQFNESQQKLQNYHTQTVSSLAKGFGDIHEQYFQYVISKPKKATVLHESKKTHEFQKSSGPTARRSIYGNLVV